MEKPTTLQVRINSVTDAKAAVHASPSIVRRMKKEGFTHLKIFVAEEVHKEAMDLLAGVFPTKVAYSKVKASPGTVLFVLPAFQER